MKTKDEKKIIKVEIIDTGKGIPKENLENIFERFYQLGNEEGKVSGGGVDIRSNVIAPGFIETEMTSELNKETKFTVYIPSKDIDQIDVKEIQKKKTFIKNWLPLKIEKGIEIVDTEEPMKKKHSVLVVENEIDIQNFLKTALSNNYNITIANNGIEALEKIKQTQFSTVISDVMMPEMDGFELCEKH